MSLSGIRWSGPRALLVELSDLPSVLAFHSRLLAEPLPGQLDAVAAAATVLIKFGTHAEALAARAAVGHVDRGGVRRDGSRDVTIEVVYDGEDLTEVGMLTSLGRDGVVAAHTASFGLRLSEDSPRASHICSAKTAASTFPAAARHVPPFPPVPWRSAERSPPPTRGNPRAAGN